MTPTTPAQILAILLDRATCPDCGGAALEAWIDEDEVGHGRDCPTCHGTGYTLGELDGPTRQRAAAALLPVLREEVAGWLPGARILGPWVESHGQWYRFDPESVIAPANVRPAGGGGWVARVQIGDDDRQSRPYPTLDAARAWCDAALRAAGWALSGAVYVPMGEGEVARRVRRPAEQNRPLCGGSGNYRTEPCEPCRGTGRVAAERAT